MDVVQTIMHFEDRKVQPVRNKISGEVLERVYLKYRCVRLARAFSVVSVMESKGYSYPYSHLKLCHGRGKSVMEQLKIIKNLYCKSLQQTEQCGGSIGYNFGEEDVGE